MAEFSEGHVFGIGGEMNTTVMPEVDDITGENVMHAERRHTRLSRRRLMAFLDMVQVRVPQAFDQGDRMLGTWARGRIETQIDYVGVSKGATATASVHRERGRYMSASDHFPIHAKVSFKLAVKTEEWDGIKIKSLKGWQPSTPADLAKFQQRVLETCGKSQSLGRKEEMVRKLAMNTPHTQFHLRLKHANLNVNQDISRVKREIRESVHNLTEVGVKVIKK